MTTFAIATLGCKVNTYESQGYESALIAKGYEEVSFKEKADVYIINTCAVTNTAGSKSRQKIHQARHTNPDAIIAVVGCYVQTAKEQLELMEHVDILIGSALKQTLADRIEQAVNGNKVENVLQDVRALRVFEALPVRHFEHQTRAFLKIQDGCNQFCSYCIIPFARGAERSLPEDEVVQTAKNLCASGHREIVLSGIHTGRYGRDLKTNLTHVMKRLCNEVKDLQRIRISSIEMNEITDELLEFMQQEPRIARHLHIPIQTANNTVLKNMNRPYNVEWFMERVDYIRSLMPDISISSDVIVGFPQVKNNSKIRWTIFVKSTLVSFTSSHIQNVIIRWLRKCQDIGIIKQRRSVHLDLHNAQKSYILLINNSSSIKKWMCYLKKKWMECYLDIRVNI